MSGSRRQAALRRRPDPQPETVLEDGQRRLLLVLLGAGLACTLVGLAWAPAGASFWLALVLLPGLAAAFGFWLGGARGRRLDTWLLGGPAAAGWQAPPPGALPKPLRAALDEALLPPLLAHLARSADRQFAPRQQAAAKALAQAALARWQGARMDPALAPLAHDLPRLIAGLATAEEAATRQAELLAAQLATAAAAAGGRRP